MWHFQWYSQFHAARIFKSVTGLTLFEYIRRERLVASAHLLRLGRHKVLDVAFDFVFDSQEGFIRAFSNGFGISPEAVCDEAKCLKGAYTFPLH
jgi:AraC-like DNA-binding protein